MDRIVDIATDGQHLKAIRGHMVVSNKDGEVGRVPLDDIAAVIVHAHGTTYSNHLFTALAKRGALLVICAPNHSPVSVLTPIIGHHLQTGNMSAQADAGKPLSKRLWQQIVISKIKMQEAALEAFSEPIVGFHLLAQKVRSGDPDNIEAQAARKYWPLMMGESFRRDRDASGANALLNYGYAIMRAICARAIVAAGLHPSLGIHHHNRLNPFTLADDLVEPFRPIVDCAVRVMMAEGVTSVDSAAKQRLAALTAFDMVGPSGISPVHVCAGRFAQSLAASFVQKKPQLVLPRAPDRLALASAGRLN